MREFSRTRALVGPRAYDATGGRWGRGLMKDGAYVVVLGSRRGSSTGCGWVFGGLELNDGAYYLELSCVYHTTIHLLYSCMYYLGRW